MNSPFLPAIAQGFQVDGGALFQTPRGRGQENLARSAALYVARKTAERRLTAIAEYFGLSHYGSVFGSNSRFETRMKQDKPLARIVDRVNKTINKQT